MTPSRKRGHGEGSLWQRPNGTWTAQVTLDGKRVSKTFDTRPKARAWIAEITQQAQRGLTFAATRTTFGEFFAGWLASQRAAVRPAVFARYAQISRTHLAPLSSLKLSAVRPGHIQPIINAAAETPAAAVKIYALLHKVFEHACRQGMVPANPASRDVLILPVSASDEMSILDESQVSALLVAANSDRLYALYLLAVTTGMRQSELLGLTWSDVDWSGILKVQRQLSRKTEGVFNLVELKTKFSRRAITLDPRVVDALREHRERQQTETPFYTRREIDLVFCTQSGAPINQRALLAHFVSLLAAAGLPAIRFHDLRHTAASIMLNNGVPAIVVSRILGHSSARITLDVYGHLIPHHQEQVARQMADLLLPVRLQPIATDAPTDTPTDGKKTP